MTPAIATCWVPPQQHGMAATTRNIVEIFSFCLFLIPEIVSHPAVARLIIIRQSLCTN